MSRGDVVRVGLMALIAVSAFVGGCAFNEIVVDPLQAEARAKVGSPAVGQTTESCGELTERQETSDPRP